MSRSTRTRQSPNSISMIPILATGKGRGCGPQIDAGVVEDEISTGTRAGTVSPKPSWCACRRHVNNWLADNP